MDYLQYLLVMDLKLLLVLVLNLIINGLPSILEQDLKVLFFLLLVLNLIINGLPSIHK